MGGHLFGHPRRKQDKRQEDQRRKQCVEQQYRQDGIPVERLFFEYVVEAQ